MLDTLRSLLARRPSARTGAPSVARRATPPVIRAVDGALPARYVDALRQAAGVDASTTALIDAETVADLVRWGYLAYQDTGDLRLTDAGRSALARGAA